MVVVNYLEDITVCDAEQYKFGRFVQDYWQELRWEYYLVEFERLFVDVDKSEIEWDEGYLDWKAV